MMEKPSALIGKVTLLCGVIIVMTIVMVPDWSLINPVLLAVGGMMALFLVRIPFPVAIIIAALLGDVHSGMTLTDVIDTMNNHLHPGAVVGSR